MIKKTSTITKEKKEIKVNNKKQKLPTNENYDGPPLEDLGDVDSSVKEEDQAPPPPPANL